MCVFIALWEHQRMLWDVCDPTCKNRNKRTDVLTLRTEVSEDVFARWALDESAK